MEMSEQTLGKLPQTEIIFGKLLSRLEKEANNQGQSNQELRGQVQETRSKTHEVTYITSSAVGPGYLVRENLKTLSAPAQTDKALTRRGDIVIKLTKPFDSALVRTPEEENLLVTSTCAIIRIDRDAGVNPAYFAGFLLRPGVRSWLLDAAGGSTLKRSALEPLRLALPDEETQKKLGLLHVRVVESELAQLAAIDEGRSLRDAFYEDALKNHLAVVSTD